MADDLNALRKRAAAARRTADDLEAARLKANDDARKAAAGAVALERAVDAAEYAAHVAEYGEPTRAPINLEASTPAELDAARGSGVDFGGAPA